MSSDEEPAMNESGGRRLRMFGFIALAVSALALGATMPTSDYSAAKERASMEYQSARAQCSRLSGNTRVVCFVEARSVERKAMAEAEARYRNTDSARLDATIESAEADFDVAKAKCGAKAGNDKDVCIKEAKAVEVRTKAEAIASEKIAAVWRDARDDERAADYEVAIEKCDALAGASKDRCVADAKAKYRK
jgi:hypothetical protein